MKSKGLAGALSMTVAVLLACWAARGDNSKSEFNWSMPGLDKWLLGMYSDGLAGWDVEPEKRLPSESPTPRLVPGMGPSTASRESAALLPPSIWALMFDPALSEVYAEWGSDRPASFEPQKVWEESFDGFGLPAGIEWDTLSLSAPLPKYGRKQDGRHRQSTLPFFELVHQSREAM